MPGNTAIPGRTNVIQELFFLNHENRRWTGIGYRVGTGFTAFHYTLHSTNNTSGYEQTIQTAGDRTPRITRSVDGNPELAAGGVTTPDAERRIAEAFPFTTGAALRTAIEDTARPFELAERLDLPRP